MTDHNINNQIYIDHLKMWNRFIQLTRQFFESNDFLEVNTPSLLVSPGTEPYIDFIPVKATQNNRVHNLYLPSSPEYSLKKLLSLSTGPIFEIRPCYRDNESSGLHRTEFFMLEWYIPQMPFAELMDFTLRYINWLIENFKKRPAPCFNHLPENLISNKVTISELFKTYLDFNLTPATEQAELFELAQDQGLFCQSDWKWDELFSLLMIEKIEPQLKDDKLYFIYNYPPAQAALATLNQEGWANRFELYWKGIELANAYDELILPQEQLKRIHADNAVRASLGRSQIPIDEAFILALPKLGQTSGIALGLERLFMILMHQSDIHFWSPLWTSSLSESASL